MALAKFTFKRHPRETGLAAVGRPFQDVDIKFKGKVIGLISAPSSFSKWKNFRVMFQVKADTAEHACGWRWATLKYQGQSEEAVRQWLNENAQTLIEKFDFYDERI